MIVVSSRGSLPWTRFLDLSLYFVKEFDHSPWERALPTLNRLIDHFKYQNEYALMMVHGAQKIC
jgi:hypothetical protein